jgi:hypothetical protein
MHSRARDANWFKFNSPAFSQDFKTSSGRSSLCQLSCGSYITGESTLERQTLFRYFTEERSRECGLTLASCKKKKTGQETGGPRIPFHPIQPDNPSKFCRSKEKENQVS